MQVTKYQSVKWLWQLSIQVYWAELDGTFTVGIWKQLSYTPGNHAAASAFVILGFNYIVWVVLVILTAFCLEWD